MRASFHDTWHAVALFVVGSTLGARPAVAQRAAPAPATDPVVQRIYTEGMQHSHAAALAQALMDSIGPRLTGSPANRAANDWLVRTYTAWGVPVRNERYGTWRDWTRGITRLELVTPRVRLLEALARPWSPPTPPGGVTGEVVAPPPASVTRDSTGFARWLGTVRGKFVLLSVPEPTCRPDSSWMRYALPSTYQALRAARDSARAEWQSRLAVTGLRGRGLRARFDGTGVAGILTAEWSGGWGTSKTEMVAGTNTTPVFGVSCEDYSLLARLAEHGQHPTMHAVADVQTAPTEAPVYNTIAELRGTTHPEQVVMLSAHLDSWDPASGATDNGTGTIIMLEAMRLLKLAYPHPKRTILAGHWSGEEEGDIGSMAFAQDHPEVVRNLQALFNQDIGTGRTSKISAVGLASATPALTRWLAPLPSVVTNGAQVVTGKAEDQSTDVDAFACHDAPGFDVEPDNWDYDTYTWHTDRDTYDKLSFDDIERTATLVALLAYEASEDPQSLARPSRQRYPCSPTPRSWKAAMGG